MTPKRTIVEVTVSQEDYLEIIYRQSRKMPAAKVRITDIASALRTKLPTVTRTIQRLTALGLTDHQARGGVTLTPSGLALAREIAHRHDDLVSFFSSVLGLPQNIAEESACKIEHGLNGQAAQRLHEFMERYFALSPSEKAALSLSSNATKRGRAGGGGEFSHLRLRQINGWRG